MREVAALMRVAGGVKGLRRVTVDADIYLQRNGLDDILKSFDKHATLHTLDVAVSGGNYFTADLLDVLPQLMAFAGSCPALAHLTLSAGTREAPAGVSMATFLARAGGEVSLEDCAAAMAFLKKPNCPLQSLTLPGLPLPPNALRALFEALAENTSFKHLALSQGYMDLESTVFLMRALEKNKTLLSIRLPTEPGACFWRSPDQRVHSLRGAMPCHRRTRPLCCRWRTAPRRRTTRSRSRPLRTWTGVRRPC